MLEHSIFKLYNFVGRSLQSSLLSAYKLISTNNLTQVLLLYYDISGMLVDMNINIGIKLFYLI
jgi:hypothetical protein